MLILMERSNAYERDVESLFDVYGDNEVNTWIDAYNIAKEHDGAFYISSMFNIDGIHGTKFTIIPPEKLDVSEITESVLRHDGIMEHILDKLTDQEEVKTSLVKRALMTRRSDMVKDVFNPTTYNKRDNESRHVPRLAEVYLKDHMKTIVDMLVNDKRFMTGVKSRFAEAQSKNGHASAQGVIDIVRNYVVTRQPVAWPTTGQILEPFMTNYNPDVIEKIDESYKDRLIENSPKAYDNILADIMHCIDQNLDELEEVIVPGRAGQSAVEYALKHLKVEDWFTRHFTTLFGGNHNDIVESNQSKVHSIVKDHSGPQATDELIDLVSELACINLVSLESVFYGYSLDYFDEMVREPGEFHDQLERDCDEYMENEYGF